MVLKAAKAGMLISVAKTYNKFSITQLGHKGFSIIEILMALMLLVVLFTLVPLGLGVSDRENLEETMAKLDRALNFAVSESVLRNKIVRIKFDLDKSPVEYSIEYGQSANIVLIESKDLTKLSLKEREREEEKLKKIDGQFLKTDDFEDSNEAFPENVYFAGIATDFYPQIKIDGQPSIYFYPSGERDSALIVLHTQEEIATLEIPSFEERTFDNYYPFSENDLVNLDYAIESITKDLVEKWRKN